MPLQNTLLHHTKQKLIFIEKFFAGFSLLLLLILSLSQVILRNFFELGFSEIDVISRHLVLFVTFMGAALAIEGGQHIKMDFLTSLMKQETKNKISLPLLFLSTLICSAFFWYALQFWLDEKQYAPANEQLALYMALILPIGFFTLSFHFLLQLLSLWLQAEPQHKNT